MALDIVRVDSVGQAAGVLAGDDGARFLAAGRSWFARLPRATPRSGNSCSPTASASTASRSARRSPSAAPSPWRRWREEPGLAFLAPVAESIGGPAVRNMATVGGNLFARSPYGDFAVALLALGATVVSETLRRGKSRGS